LPEPRTQETHAYTDGASTGSRGPGGYGTVLTWEGRTEENSGGGQGTANLRVEATAACVALGAIDKGHRVTVYSDCSYLVNCMKRGWYKKWRENGWLNHIKEPVANRGLWERLLEAEQRHQDVRWRKVKGHSKAEARTRAGTTGPTRWPWPPKWRQRVRQHRPYHDAMAPATSTRSDRIANLHLQGDRRDAIHLLLTPL
jgi:ribonuclease HI